MVHMQAYFNAALCLQVSSRWNRLGSRIMCRLKRIFSARLRSMNIYILFHYAQQIVTVRYVENIVACI